MKKILLGTTAIIGALGLFAGSAQAGGLNVNVGGFLDFQAGVTDNDLYPSQHDVLFQNDTEIHIKAEGKADNGLEYGAVVELEADVTADADGEGVNADKTYLFLQGGWGRAEFGNNTDSAEVLSVNTSNFARATGGTDGDWYDFVAPGVLSGFIISPDLPLAHAAGVAEDATKISYYSPKFNGFQLGLSYIPDSGNGGTASGFTTKKNSGQAENVVTAGLNYTHQFNQVGLSAAVTGEMGDSEVSTREDLAAWDIGLNLTYAGWTLGGSWADWGDSLLTKTTADKDQNYWDIGLGYETGPFGVSVAYLSSEVSGNDFTNVAVSADYKLAQGLVPYAEVNFVDFDKAGPGGDNDGTVFLLGAELNF